MTSTPMTTTAYTAIPHATHSPTLHATSSPSTRMPLAALVDTDAGPAAPVGVASPFRLAVEVALVEPAVWLCVALAAGTRLFFALRGA